MLESKEISRHFFDDIDAHFESLKNKKVKESNENLKFKKGRKLYLEVTVVDEEMTPWLFNWLYKKTEDNKPVTPFGCELQIIHFDKVVNNELKSKLIKIIEEEL